MYPHDEKQLQLDHLNGNDALRRDFFCGLGIGALLYLLRFFDSLCFFLFGLEEDESSDDITFLLHLFWSDASARKPEAL